MIILLRLATRRIHDGVNQNEFGYFYCVDHAEPNDEECTETAFPVGTTLGFNSTHVIQPLGTSPYKQNTLIRPDSSNHHTKRKLTGIIF